MPLLWLLALIAPLAAVPLWADPNAGFHVGMAQEDLNNIAKRQAGITDPEHPNNSQSTNSNDARQRVFSQNLIKAEDHLAAITAKLRSKFETTPDWIAGMKNLQQALIAYDQAKAAVTEKLGEQADFQAAAHDQIQAMQDLSDARTAGQDADKLSALATVAIAAGKKVSEMQSAALNADPAVQAAQVPVAQARAAMDKLRGQFEDSLPANADWAAANTAVKNARAQVLEAEGRPRTVTVAATTAAGGPVTQPSPPATAKSANP